MDRFEPEQDAPHPPNDEPEAFSGVAPMPLSLPPFGAPAAPDPASATESGRRAGRRTLVGAVAAAVLVAGGLGGALGAALAGGGTVVAGKTASGEVNVAAIANSVDPAVVDITTTVATAEGDEEAAGTGMIISSSGLVLTNNHVVEDATAIAVTVQGSAHTYSVKVLGEDPDADIALLQLVGASGLPTVTLGDSATASLGESVVAIGNALGLGHSPSVAAGAITALDRTISASDESSSTSETLHGLIETDAAIVPGDSGGPLVDSSGQVIGMDTAAASGEETSSTIGFAIPIDTALSIAREIEAGSSASGIHLGTDAFLGVIEASYGEVGATSTGIPVAAVVEGGAAASAGIEPGDTIVSIDGTAVETFAELQAAVEAHAAGSTISVGIVTAAGESETVPARLGWIVP